MDPLRWLKNKIIAPTGVDYGYFLRHGSATLLQNAGALAFAIAASILLIAKLPVAVYGNYAYIMALIGICGACTLSGMNTAVAQAAACGREKALDIAVRIQTRWCAALSLPFGAYALYLYDTGVDGSFIGALVIAGGAFLITTTLSPASAFLFGKKEFKRLAFYGIAFNGMTLILLAIVTSRTDSLIAVMCAYGFSSVSSALYLYIRARALYARKIINTPEKDDGSLFRFSGHLSIINAFSILAEHADKIILFHFLGPVQLAIYSIASHIMDAGKAAIRSVISVSLPKLSMTAMTDIRRGMMGRVIWGMGAGIIVCVAYWIIIPPMIKGIFPEYRPAIAYAQLLGISFIFIIPITHIAYVFHSQKMMVMLYVNGILPNMMRILCYMGAAAYWGIEGIVISRIVLYAFTLCVNSISIFAEKNGQRPISRNGS